MRIAARYMKSICNASRRRVQQGCAGFPLKSVRVTRMQEQADDSPGDPRRRALLLAVSLMVIAFNLRTAVTSLGPVLLDAIAGLRLTGAEASLLASSGESAIVPASSDFAGLDSMRAAGDNGATRRASKGVTGAVARRCA